MLSYTLLPGLTKFTKEQTSKITAPQVFLWLFVLFKLATIMISSISIVASFLAIMCFITSSNASPAFSRGVLSPAVFSVPRGGGLFGGKDKDAKTEEG
jgi:hypothetical protein